MTRSVSVGLGVGANSDGATPSSTELLFSGTAGPRVLLLHPFLMSKEVWEPVVNNLALDHKVVALTLPGHWGGPVMPAGRLTPAVLADHVEEVMDLLGWDDFHVVGNSLGGWVAYELAKRGRCLSVIAFAPAGGWSRRWSTRLRLIVKFLFFGLVGAVGVVIGPLLVRSRRLTAAAFRPMAPSIAKATDSQLRAVYAAAGHCRAYFPLLAFGIRGGVAHRTRDIDCPVSLYVSDADRVLDAGDFMRYERGGPNVSIRHLEGVGHVPMLQDPERVARIIRADVADRQLE